MYNILSINKYNIISFSFSHFLIPAIVDVLTCHERCFVGWVGDVLCSVIKIEPVKNEQSVYESADRWWKFGGKLGSCIL